MKRRYAVCYEDDYWGWRVECEHRSLDVAIKHKKKFQKLHPERNWKICPEMPETPGIYITDLPN